MLAAIRACPTHRPTSDIAAPCGATTAAITLAKQLRTAATPLPPEALREALGASCRVGRLVTPPQTHMLHCCHGTADEAWGRVQALVRNVLLLMEASSPPYQHSSESLGMLLKFLIDRREFWR